MEKKFACVINCMDGRIQEAVIEYMKNKYQTMYIDNITLAGPSKVIAENIMDDIIDNVKFRVDISVSNHGAKVIAVVGHFDCAGIPSTDEQQKQYVLQATKEVKTWKDGIEVIPLWVDKELKVTLIK